MDHEQPDERGLPAVAGGASWMGIQGARHAAFEASRVPMGRGNGHPVFKEYCRPCPLNNCAGAPKPDLGAPKNRWPRNQGPTTSNFSNEDYDDVLVAVQPQGIVRMSHVIVESVKRTVKVGCNDHSDLGGGCAEYLTHGKPAAWPKCGIGGSCNLICQSTTGEPRIGRHVW